MMYGHFDDALREYVITRPDTPWPWINYLGSEDFFSLVSNAGGGYSFYRDARLRRLTRYRYNDVPLDANGRLFYIKDGAVHLESRLAPHAHGPGILRVPPRHGIHPDPVPAGGHRGRAAFFRAHRARTAKCSAWC